LVRLGVTGKAVVTSGDYERYFIDREGKRWHHILNPTSGYPSESGLISVTIIADSAMVADALSTIVFVVGMERGLELLDAFPGTEAILVDNRQQVYITQNLKDCYQTTEGIHANVI
jgi:thiamine biosynthesis lipoprotein